MAKPIFDQNGDGLVSEEEAKFFLSGQTEMTREEFVSFHFYNLVRSEIYSNVFKYCFYRSKSSRFRRNYYLFIFIVFKK